MSGWPPLPDLIVLLVAEPTVMVAYVVFGMVGFGTTLVSAPTWIARKCYGWCRQW